ncbi:MAG: HEPN domain-containing protein [Candidatus Bipolaricaulaceae bacterium]
MDQAEGDLLHAQSDAEHGFYEWSRFSAQKAAEKAVKTVFQRLGVEAWGYSVADLLRELSRHRSVPDELMQAALELDKVYILARYPNADPSGLPRRRYTKEEALRLIGHAERILWFCQDLLAQA